MGDAMIVRLILLVAALGLGLGLVPMRRAPTGAGWVLADHLLPG